MMSTFQALFLGAAICWPVGEAPPSKPDLAALREVLHDAGQPLGQSQAALLLVQAHTPEANRILHQVLQEVESPEPFRAVAAALRLSADRRFNDDLRAALLSGRAGVRQDAADTLALLVQAPATMATLVRDTTTDIAVRQAVLLALGRSGRRQAAAILMEQLSAPDAIRQTTAEALTELTGHSYGTDIARWHAWWATHGNVSDERWLEERLYYQDSRNRRLAGELEQARSQVVHLEQQLYSRLPLADRPVHIQTLADAPQAEMRALAVAWSLEIWSSVDNLGRQALATVLLHLSEDSSAEVQKAAVLALGRIAEPRAFARLCELIRTGRPGVRAAAARALTQQATSTATDPRYAKSIQHQIVPVLQQALEDASYEVVIEAAEDLGSLGAPEAGPVLTSLLHHSAEPVRQAAARALERVADRAVINGLLAALSDSAMAVRFSLIGALGHAAGDGRDLTETQHAMLMERLEDLLLHDPDASVRSRAATVLGECGSPTVVPLLWRHARTAEDSRVQEKAWSALVRIIARSQNPMLLKTWDSRLAGAHQDNRRVQLLATIADEWKSREETAALVGPVTDTLIQAYLDQKRWSAALPLIRESLKRPAASAEMEHRLRWLLVAGQQALGAGNATECLHIVQQAQPYLGGDTPLSREFVALDKSARKQR